MRPSTIKDIVVVTPFSIVPAKILPIQTIFARGLISPWWWRQYIPLKRQSASTRHYIPQGSRLLSYIFHMWEGKDTF
jgi:hypothetical protein